MARGWWAPSVASTSRPISWTTGTPRFPPPALTPRAQPFSRAGKNALILVIDEAKLPPPTPANSEMTSRVSNSTPGLSTTAIRIEGSNSSRAEAMVQLRPPNKPTAKV